MISHKKFASRRRFIFLPTYFMLENHAWVNTYLYFFWWSCVFGSFEWMFHRAFCRPNKENMYCNYLNKKKTKCIFAINYYYHSQNGLLRSPSSPFGVPSHRTIQPMKLYMWNFVLSNTESNFFCLIQRVIFFLSNTESKFYVLV